MSGRVYRITPEEARRMLYYRSLGMSIERIALMFGRSYKAVERVLRGRDAKKTH